MFLVAIGALFVGWRHQRDTTVTPARDLQVGVEGGI
jgi:hypothetical protein